MRAACCWVIASTGWPRQSPVRLTGAMCMSVHEPDGVRIAGQHSIGRVQPGGLIRDGSIARAATPGVSGYRQPASYRPEWATSSPCARPPTRLADTQAYGGCEVAEGVHRRGSHEVQPRVGSAARRSTLGAACTASRAPPWRNGSRLRPHQANPLPGRDPPEACA
jgi:hypothetical protein